jgi:Fic family protein
MNRGKQGEDIICTTASELYRAFVPFPLPPRPEIAGNKTQYEKALLALGRLDSLSAFIPVPDLFLYFYVRKEAVLSSQIEGTQYSLADLLLY